MATMWFEDLSEIWVLTFESKGEEGVYSLKDMSGEDTSDIIIAFEAKEDAERVAGLLQVIVECPLLAHTAGGKQSTHFVPVHHAFGDAPGIGGQQYSTLCVRCFECDAEVLAESRFWPDPHEPTGVCSTPPPSLEPQGYLPLTARPCGIAPQELVEFVTESNYNLHVEPRGSLFSPPGISTEQTDFEVRCTGARRCLERPHGAWGACQQDFTTICLNDAGRAGECRMRSLLINSASRAMQRSMNLREGKFTVLEDDLSDGWDTPS